MKAQNSNSTFFSFCLFFPFVKPHSAFSIPPPPLPPKKRKEREKIKLLIFQSTVPSNNTVTKAIELLTWSREQRGKRPYVFYTALMLRLTKQVYASRENIAPTVLYQVARVCTCGPGPDVEYVHPTPFILQLALLIFTSLILHFLNHGRLKEHGAIRQMWSIQALLMLSQQPNNPPHYSRCDHVLQ